MYCAAQGSNGSQDTAGTGYTARYQSGQTTMMTEDKVNAGAAGSNTASCQIPNASSDYIITAAAFKSLASVARGQPMVF